MTTNLLCSAALTLAALAGTAAAAETVTLDRPLAGATVIENGVAISVYRAPSAEASEIVEVVATYAPLAAPERTGRVVMQMAEGDSASFGLPGLPGLKLDFTRDAETVSFGADTLPVVYAAGY